eukprot:scaffold166240_cov18-Prasinocladus_malaysianus.AAC.1
MFRVESWGRAQSCSINFSFVITSNCALERTCKGIIVVEGSMFDLQGMASVAWSLAKLHFYSPPLMSAIAKDAA